MRIKLTVIATGVICFLGSVNCIGQGLEVEAKGQKDRQEALSHVLSRQDAAQAEKAAEQFILHFRENLNFGDAFDKSFVSDAVKRLREADFFIDLNFTPELIDKADDESLKRAYKAFMNFYYLRDVYDLNTEPGTQVSSRPESAEFSLAFQTSRYLKKLSDDDRGDDGPPVKTQEDLIQISEEFERIADLYRSYLPKDPWSKTFRSNLRKRDIDRKVRVRRGYPAFNLDPTTNVYMLQRDIFDFSFIKVNNQMKVLVLGIGN